jgi:hypothetical protein
MKLPNGDIIVPPSCPDIRSYGDTEIRDTGSAVMGYDALDAQCDSGGNSTVTEIMIDFRRSAQSAPFIEVKSVIAPIDSELANDARDLADEKDSGRQERVERLRNMLCDRVAHCPGVTGDGECWALGPGAIEETIRSVMHE